MNHYCADENGDFICDLCGWGMQHDCIDSDCNDVCDICTHSVSGSTASVAVSVTSYLDKDIPGSIRFTSLYTDTGDSFLGTDYSNDWIVGCGTYQWTATKFGHTPRTGNFTGGENGAELIIKLCPIGDASGDGKLNMGDSASLYAHIRGTKKLY